MAIRKSIPGSSPRIWGIFTDNRPFLPTPVAVAVEEPPLPPMPVSEVLGTLAIPEDGPDDEYLKLAAEVDFSYPEMDTMLLRRKLTALEIPVYDMKKVVAFMDGIVNQANRGRGPLQSYLCWYWRPLARKGKGIQSQLMNRPVIASSAAIDPAFWSPGYNIHDGYAKPIPLEVLKVAKEVKDSIQDAVFWVSDYAVRHPDPFLAVSMRESEKFVIAHWDEPGFKLVEKKK